LRSLSKAGDKEIGDDGERVECIAVEAEEVAGTLE
jgi:hypothetical protein